MQNLTLEERKFSAGGWFDGAHWTLPREVYYLEPEDVVRRKRRSMAKKQPAFMTLGKYFDTVSLVHEAYQKFIELRIKEPFSQEHEAKLSYWLNHPRLVIREVLWNRADPVALILVIEYEDFVVCQACLPLPLGVNYVAGHANFYNEKLGHRVNLALPRMFKKKVLFGPNSAFDYVKRGCDCNNCVGKCPCGKEG